MNMNGTRLVVAVLGGAATVALTLIVISLATGGGDSTTTTVASTATSTTPEPPTQIETASLAAIRGLAQHGFVLGPASAKPLIVEYADLQCPFCADYSTGTQHEVIDRYVKPGTARLEFRGLSFIGEDSTRALRFVHAAAAKNKAWNVIELLYENQGEENSGWVTDGLVRAIATEVGLDPAPMVGSLTSTALRRGDRAHQRPGPGRRRRRHAEPLRRRRRAQRVHRQGRRRRRRIRGRDRDGDLGLSDRRLRLAIVGLALAGIAIAGYLSWERLSGGTVACPIGGGGCKTVQESSYSELAGIPVAYLGVATYVLLLGLALWDSEQARAVLASVALAGLAFAVYLLVIMAVVIDAYCSWCLASDAVLAMIAALGLVRLRGSRA